MRHETHRAECARAAGSGARQWLQGLGRSSEMAAVGAGKPECQGVPEVGGGRIAAPTSTAPAWDEAVPARIVVLH